jgi:hypothetical protein
MSRLARFKIPSPNYAIGAPEGCAVFIDRDALGGSEARREEGQAAPRHTIVNTCSGPKSIV